MKWIYRNWLNARYAHFCAILSIVFAGAVLLSASLALPAPAHAETSEIAPPPRVAVSIRPLYSLVAAVMEGISQPTLLVPGNQSPHIFSLAPSQAQILEQAEIVFLIDPEFERFLRAPLSNLAKNAQVVAMSRTNGMVLLDYPESSHGQETGAHHAHSHEGKDYHLWLDPERAARMGEAIAMTLIARDPSRAAQYKENAVKLRQKLDNLNVEIITMMTEAKKKQKPGTLPYLAYHDAYRYFEMRYQLDGAASITKNPEYNLGAQSLAALERRLKGVKLNCIFAEPQFNPPIIARLAERTGAAIHELNPDGSAAKDDKEAYFESLRAIAGDIATCIKK